MHKLFKLKLIWAHNTANVQEYLAFRNLVDITYPYFTSERNQETEGERGSEGVRDAEREGGEEILRDIKILISLN